ncbi:HelD family protein [Micromonospora sp. NBC_01796]|uniref:HelD family protein n=1 Tax=Micromonospora sp. NBC_01796 TaxID=2975987 RepID=UPI002DDC79D1|nr:AAA family ATPase [Micromonospora sp. NBC_01796]WSA88166.1 AAA family ATPase [Micromonospora sp. NBC_01796]
MPAPDLDTDLTGERAHLDASRAALHRMRRRAEALFSTGENVAGDSYTAEMLGRTLSRRVAELADDPTTPLFFGRLTFPEVDYHIGRRHVTDDLGEPMVLDWRAPVSRSFYRASVRDPQGVNVRRRFGFSSGLLTSFEDEHLDRGEELGTASRILTSEIERPRVGPMRDIVATIQPEQDELVRADLETSICVQGAPGTGKTAVGLHRAAYLLYLHRERLRRSGVLIVGPNRAFLSYIAAVLPALGEVEVAQATVEDLVTASSVRPESADRPRTIPVRGTDAPATAEIKHDVRMAEVLRRAVEAHIREPEQPITVSDGSFRWRIGREVLRRIVDEVRREGLPYGTGRERVRARVVGLLQLQSEARGESPTDAWLRRMGKIQPVTEFLDAAWPALTPDGLVYHLLSDPVALATAAEDLLTDAEQALLLWAKPPRTARAAKWSTADTVLIDEAAGLIERVTSFGHVVVDEAQDLSPMQCRAIARRSVHGSITLLGDLAQGTAPWAATDWRESLAHLGKPDAAVVPLTIGFRVPAAVVAFANQLLPALAVDVPPAESLRRDGSLDLRTVTDLDAATVTEVRAALVYEGSVAVIAADAAIERLTAALTGAGIATSTADDVEAPERVTVVPASLVKGLEYDHVIVVEPAEIVAAEPRGLHRLYVVLTRAVSRLAVLHHEPLPAPL